MCAKSRFRGSRSPERARTRDLASYSALTANPAYRTAYMADGLHPNDTGYAVLGDTWYAALAPYL